MPCSRSPIDQFLAADFLLPQILQAAQNALQAALPDIRWMNMILALFQQIARKFSELDSKFIVSLIGRELVGAVCETLAEGCVGKCEIVGYIITV